VNVNLVFAVTFMLGAGLAGFGGVIGAVELSMVPGEDTRLLLGLNAVRCYDLDLSQLTEIAQRVGPTPTKLQQDPDLRTPPNAIREANGTPSARRRTTPNATSPNDRRASFWDRFVLGHSASPTAAACQQGGGSSRAGRQSSNSASGVQAARSSASGAACSNRRTVGSGNWNQWSARRTGSRACVRNSRLRSAISRRTA
jgi:hypothetical protein